MHAISTLLEQATAAKAREEAARLEGQLASTSQLNETLMLRTRELQEQRASAVASGGATGGADGGLAEELSAARRTIASLEQTATAEKGHAQQYRLLAEATEKERDEQAALTAELKAATDKQIEQLQTAKRVLEEEKATVLRAESARAEEAAQDAVPLEIGHLRRRAPLISQQHL